MLKVMLHDNEHSTNLCSRFEIVNMYGFDMIRPKRVVAGACTFLRPDNLCALHDIGLKPTEGAEVMCTSTPEESRKIHNHVAAQWNVVGYTIIKLFRDKHENS